MSILDLNVSSPAQRGHLKVSSDCAGWKELQKDIEDAGMQLMEIKSVEGLNLVFDMLRHEERWRIERHPSFLRVNEAVIQAQHRVSGIMHMQTANALRNGRCCLLMDCAPISTWDPVEMFFTHLQFTGDMWHAKFTPERYKKVRTVHEGKVLRFIRDNLN